MNNLSIKILIVSVLISIPTWLWSQSFPTMAYSFNPGNTSSTPRRMVVGGGSLFAIADSGGGSYVWKYDGTTAQRISQFGVVPVELVFMDNNIYYTATNLSSETIVYKWDGSTITEIRSIPTGNPASQYLTVYNNDLYFSSVTASSGVELHKYNGTTLSFIEGNPSGGCFPDRMRVVNNKIYFYGTTNSFNNEPFECNGITAIPLANVNPAGNSFANEFIEFQGLVYFAANNGTSGQELYRYNGSTVTLAADINPTGNSNPTNLKIYNNNLYFAANNGTNGIELWKFDGTVATMVADLRAGATGSNPQQLTVCDNKLFFVADNGVAGSEVWEYDGTNLVLYDVVPGATGSGATSLFSFNNSLFFSANGGPIGTELHRIFNSILSNYDINTNVLNSTPQSFVAWNNKLYFDAALNGFGRELFKLCPNTSRTLTATACTSYLSPSGNYNYTTSGTYFDTIPNHTGCDSIIQLNLIINQIPSAPGSITGNITPCEFTSEGYSISPVSGATSYSWTLPGGWSGSSSSNNISTLTGNTGGVISVTANNSCGISPVTNLSINLINVPSTPDSIFGSTSVCIGASQLFNVDSIAGTSYYNWVVPSGWVGSSTTSSINLIAGTPGGDLEVTASNVCGTSLPYLLSVYSNDIPLTPGIISGNSNICSGSNENYSIVPVSSATSYNWSLPAGWSGSSNTDQINVIPNNVSGMISVNASNVCGSSGDTTVFVHVLSTPSVISNDTTICYNSFALVSAVSDSGSIEWYSEPTGGSPFATGNSYTTNVLFTDTVFYLQAENNGCITNPRVPLNITVMPMLNTNIVSTGFSLIAGDTTATYYQWIDCSNSNQPIAGANSYTFYPSDDGNYAVIIDNSICTDTSNCFIFQFFSLENEADNDIVIYPNPSVDYVTIQTSKEPLWMELLDMSGRLVKRQKFQKIFDFSSYASGTYLLKLIWEDMSSVHRISKN